MPRLLEKKYHGQKISSFLWPTRYVGPYRVLDTFNSNYVIKGIYADRRIQTVHLNRIKLARLRDDKTYPFDNHCNDPNIDVEVENEALSNVDERSKPDDLNVVERSCSYNLRSRK